MGALKMNHRIINQTTHLLADVFFLMQHVIVNNTTVDYE